MKATVIFNHTQESIAAFCISSFSFYNHPVTYNIGYTANSHSQISGNGTQTSLHYCIYVQLHFILDL